MAPNQPAPEQASVAQFAVICALLIVATALVYAQVTHFDFVNLDDGPYVIYNHYVYDPITLKSIHWAFTAVHSANWHPITWISHMIDCRLFGLTNPGGHHVTNVVLHIANTLMLFLLLVRMTGSTWRSGFVAALFALHPLHVESVAWVAERKDVLSTFFMLLTLLAYASYTARRGVLRYLLVMLLFALGLMAKPMLVSLPLLMLLLDLWPLGRLETAASAKGKSRLHPAVEKAPLFALSAASCVITYVAQHNSGAGRSTELLPLGIRIANAIFSYVSYIAKMLWPANLTPLYPHPGAHIPTWQVVGGALSLTLITFFTIRLRRKAPYLLVGWLWYVITLIPVIGLVQVGEQGMADRYTYVPLIGIFTAIAWLVALRTGKHLPRIALSAAAIVILAVLAVSSYRQVGHWRDNSTLTAHTMRATNSSGSAVVFLATGMAKDGDIDEAMALLQRYLESRPNEGRVHALLGNMLLDQGRNDDAEPHLRAAVKLEPRLASAHSVLGALLAAKGQIHDARREVELAIRIDPHCTDAQFGMGVILEAQEKPEEALKHYQRVIKIDRTRNDARGRIAAILYQQGKMDEAITILQDVIDVDPNQFNALCLLGQLHLEQGSADAATQYLRRALDITPESGYAHAYLAMALYAKEDYSGAWDEVRLAREYGVKPEPNFIRALSKMMPEPGSQP